MDAVADGSVQLVVTSPPYNVGKAYATHNDSLPLDEYLAFLNQVWHECYRVLAPGGRLCINVANTDRKPYLPLNALITAELLRMARDEGIFWQMRGEIIWDKHSTVGVSTAWGSFASSTDPVLRDVHEYIMVFSKEQFRLDDGGKTGISGGQFVDWTRSIWRPEEAREQRSEVRGQRSEVRGNVSRFTLHVHCALLTDCPSPLLENVTGHCVPLTAHRLLLIDHHDFNHRPHLRLPLGRAPGLHGRDLRQPDPVDHLCVDHRAGGGLF
jgi:SAM-dependent methyltransferase